jgi:hypothetical protein
MSANRKPRGDSVLKTQTEARQQEVVEHLLTHKLAETAAWLKADGVKVSRTSLSDFLSWYQLRSQFKGFEQSALTMIELLRRKRPDLSEPDLQGYANEFFQLQAIQQNDAQTYLAFATARGKAEMEKAKLDQQERRMQLEREKLSAQLKTKIEAGLDALYEEIKSNAAARKLYDQFRAVIAEATAG